MKMYDIHGKPITNARQDVQRAMHEEGLDELDLEELALLDDTCGDDDWADWDFGDDDWWWPVDEKCAVCKKVVCQCTYPDVISCYDDEGD